MLFRLNGLSLVKHNKNYSAIETSSGDLLFQIKKKKKNQQHDDITINLIWIWWRETIKLDHLDW